MILSSSRLAQWCVQGEHFMVQSKNNFLIFDSKYLKETVHFSAWDGQCHLSRGLLWGTLTFYISLENKERTSISVHGLPWLALKSFSLCLTEAYQSWFLIENTTPYETVHHLKSLVDEMEGPNGYVSQTPFEKAQKKIKTYLKKQSLRLEDIEPHLKETPDLADWLSNPQSMREKHNQSWQEEELNACAFFFERLESSPLNLSQRQAVLMGESHNLLLAGAGSGKTGVLLARVQYLLFRQAVSPERILILAFGKKAQEAFSSRLSKLHEGGGDVSLASLDNVEVATFHRFAMDIIQEIRGQAPRISSLVTDENKKTIWLSALIKRIFSKEETQNQWKAHLQLWPVPGVSAKRLPLDKVESRFLQWVWRLITLVAQQNLPYSTLKNQTQGKPRENSELELIWPFIAAYQAHLLEKKELDFDGLILEAIRCLKEKNTPYLTPFEHIMVDEYQDISPSRLALLEVLCATKKGPPPCVFCVGDDWQAIYRFCGADVNLTTGFLTHFPKSEVRYLDTTYRFNSKIADVANRFILANPQQVEKPLNSIVIQKEDAVHVIASECLEETLVNLCEQRKGQKTEVLFIGRNHVSLPLDLEGWKMRWPLVSFSFVTAHGSKGLEADYSFILDVNQGVFPAKQGAEGLEECLLAQEDEMLFAEERRLFYVALTRARHACWVCTRVDKVSPFIKEFWKDGYSVDFQWSKSELETIMQ